MFHLVQPWRLSPLLIIRLPEALDETMNHVLDRVANHRHAWQLLTLLSGSTPPFRFEPVYGGRIAWRFGFAEEDGNAIGATNPDAAVLDLDAPPGR